MPTAPSCAARRGGRAALAALLALSSLGLQAQPSATAQPAEAVLAPNAQLLTQGIPPVPQSLVAQVARYTDFRGHSFVDWHPSRREMLVAHRKAGANTAQLFRLRQPMDPGEQLTDGPDPVTQASYEPREGRYLVFERSAGGSEVGQLYRLTPDGEDRQPVLLTHPDERNEMVGWLNKSSQLIYSAVPLDRTAQGGSRAQLSTTLWLMDPLKPEGRRKLAELPGPGWYGARPSWDDKQMALIRYVSANESQVWLLDLESGKTRQLLPRADEPALKAVHYAGAFTPDNQSLLLVTDRFGEFLELASYELASGRLQRITSHIPWDVASVAATEDGARLAVQINVDGRSELRLFDGRTLKELPQPALPAGNLGDAHFHPKRGELAFSVNNAQGPSQIYTWTEKTAAQAWTRPYAPPGLDTTRFVEQQIVRWKSFDGLGISGLLSRPDKTRFPGKRPVIIAIHGGPEGQATMGFLGRSQYFVNELGIAYLQPNVRGSSGYGKSFLALDNGFKREDSVKDIGALLDWIAQQPDLDASRVLVMGGSYGGYMTLAVSTHYADRIAGAIDIVGISHFVTFLQNTESYRRDLRRVEYGDEREPAMREFLDRISPLSNAAKIKKPLFVVQGKNDPRVPYTEAEQIVAKVRENGTPVWYLRAENEGHGFARKENADFQFYASILFLQQTLLK